MSPRSGPAAGAQHVVCGEAHLAWLGAPGKIRRPPHLEATQDLCRPSPRPSLGPRVPAGAGRGHWASGASHSSDWGSLPPGAGAVSRGPGDTWAHTPCCLCFLSLVLSLEGGSFCLLVTLGTNITSSGSPPQSTWPHDNAAAHPLAQGACWQGPTPASASQGLPPATLPPHCVCFPSPLLDNLFAHLHFHSCFPDYKPRSVRTTSPCRWRRRSLLLTPEKGTASILCPEAPFHGQWGCQAFAHHPCNPPTASEGHNGDSKALL